MVVALTPSSLQVRHQARGLHVLPFSFSTRACLLVVYLSFLGCERPSGEESRQGRVRSNTHSRGFWCYGTVPLPVCVGSAYLGW